MKNQIQINRSIKSGNGIMLFLLTLVIILYCLEGFAQTAYITNFNDGTVSVIDIATNTVSATITVGSGPRGVSVSLDGTKVYITNTTQNTVSVINTATNTVSATITVGSHPQGISVSPDGTKVYVANYSNNTVSVINTANNTVSGTIAVGNGPLGAFITPDGTKLYVANGGSNSVSVINTVTNTVSEVIPVGSGPRGVSVSPDGTLVYVANQSDHTVSVISVATNTVSATIPVGIFPIAFGNFISTYTAPAGITQFSIDNYQLSIYPNPFSSQTSITFNEEQKNSTIKIVNVLGKEIKTMNFTGKQLIIEKGEMEEGIYFVQITDENQSVVIKKIVIQ